MFRLLDSLASAFVYSWKFLVFHQPWPPAVKGSRSVPPPVVSVPIWISISLRGITLAALHIYFRIKIKKAFHVLCIPPYHSFVIGTSSVDVVAEFQRNACLWVYGQSIHRRIIIWWSYAAVSTDDQRSLLHSLRIHHAFTRWMKKRTPSLREDVFTHLAQSTMCQVIPSTFVRKVSRTYYCHLHTRILARYIYTHAHISYILALICHPHHPLNVWKSPTHNV